MNLFAILYEPFHHIAKAQTADGEGAQNAAWTVGEAFEAVAVFNESEEARTGAAAGVSSRYTITAPKAVTLNYHDVIRRDSDGKYFRITSDGDDVVTPPMCTFSFFEVTAEEWELPGAITAEGGAANG